ncbi:P-loop containing nucleoside triphosphate hydrolase protein [Lanmaoa asiatica]|nr:P-loop containing nucleoside triphosphate hydrolase protein [Lanmaoa asiatica]
MPFSRCRILFRYVQSERQRLKSSRLHFRRFLSKSSLRSPSIGDQSRRNPPEWSCSRSKPEFVNDSSAFSTRSSKSKASSTTKLLSSTLVPDIRKFIKSNARNWAYLPHVLRRLEAFGIPRAHLPDLLSSFLADIRDGMLSDETQSVRFDLSRFTFGPADMYSSQRFDQIISQLFFTWASNPEKQRHLRTFVPQSTLDAIARLHRVADLSYPTDLFPKARAMKRKFIMHVGPTNSGKTHMALRALAASSSGLYAGPLRLLAHEIWERLNKGQIVPLGMEPEPGSEPDTTINMDVANETGSRPTVRKNGHAKYPRQCNLRTGEEFRIVADNAPLMSSTVEMASFDKSLDVAVVDEIQMIADPDRGSAWTNAVLGLPAREVHLCGEETPVPIIRDLLKDTGDELAIQESSLGGDLSQVQKGDCLVVFSRDGVFAVKAKVEERIGLRCAVAYGRLPPEIRSEQAALFNDPLSGYDVIVTSDAVGMGLNLKIKRVVFETLHKFDGQERRPLSISQIKQIAGRAGRYGLHGQRGGFVTTLHKEDIPTLCRALATSAPPLSCAVLDPPGHWMEDVSQVLPLKASTQALLEVPSYVSGIRPPFRAAAQIRLDQLSQFIDTHANDLLLSDKLLFKNCPPLRSILAQILRLYTNTIRVELDAVLSVAPFMNVLEKVERMMPDQAKARGCKDALRDLEGLHKVLVLYLWLSFRNAMAFYEADEAYELKARVGMVSSPGVVTWKGRGRWSHSNCGQVGLSASTEGESGRKRLDGGGGGCEDGRGEYPTVTGLPPFHI